MAEGDVLRVRSGRFTGEAPASSGPGTEGQIPALGADGLIASTLLPSLGGGGAGILGSPQVLWADLAETSTVPAGASTSGTIGYDSASRRVLGASGASEIWTSHALGDFLGVTAVIMCPGATGSISVGIRKRTSGGTPGTVGYWTFQSDGNTVIYIAGAAAAAPTFKGMWAGFPITVTCGVDISSRKVLVEGAAMGAATGRLAITGTSPSTFDAGDTIEAYITSNTGAPGATYSSMIVHRGMPI